MRRALAIGVSVVALGGCGDTAERPSGGASASTPAAPARPSPTASVYEAPLDPTVPGPKPKAAPVARISAGRGDALAFSTRYVSVDAGKLTFEMVNRASNVEHSIAIRGEGVDVEGELVGSGQTSRIEIVLKPGRYRFYCPVADHAAKGMRGVLVVR